MRGKYINNAGQDIRDPNYTGSAKINETIDKHKRDLLKAVGFTDEQIDMISNIVSEEEKESEPEQLDGLREALGTEDTEPVNESEDPGMSEQERELRSAILGGMKEGPDNRF